MSTGPKKNLKDNYHFGKFNLSKILQNEKKLWGANEHGKKICKYQKIISLKGTRLGQFIVVIKTSKNREF